MKNSNLLFLLLLMALAMLYVGCSGNAKEKWTVDENDVKIRTSKHADGSVCRSVTIMKDHGGIMTCRDSSGMLTQMRDAFYAVPWERVIEYYPNGKIKSELFYESMSAQPAYQKTFFENGNLKSINDSAGIRIFDEKGNLMFLKDSLGERTYGENGRLLKADTVAQNWRVDYQVGQDGRFSVSKRSLDGDSSYWARYTSDSILVSEEIRSSKGKLSKEYDSTGILYYSKFVGDSESVETDYYPDGKIWMNKVVQTRESEWEPARVSFLVEFKEYAENGVALREYELPEANTASKPVCHFRNAAGDSIAVPEPRQKYPYSLQNGYSVRSRYAFVDSCAVPRW